MARIIDNNEFNGEVENDNDVAIVDFFATWCGPCKMLSPVFEELSSEIGSKVKFLKVDIDKSPELAAQFSVASVPTMIVFKKGKAVDRLIGFVPKEKIKQTLKAYI